MDLGNIGHPHPLTKDFVTFRDVPFRTLDTKCRIKVHFSIVV
uniref:Uncharacterized protein n=1 Tax=Setaria italica TaxID=4555 RepID=K3Z1Z2_SETIT